MRIKNILHPDIWIPVVLLVVFTLPFVFTDLDLKLQTLFFREGWFLGSCQPWSVLYRLGTLPGLILSALGLFVLIGAWIWPKLQIHRRSAALIVLTLIIGPGLLVNAIGKEYWGRPRPRDVITFNGTQSFHRIIEPGIPGRGKSFPCGHASVGFLFVTLYFLSRNRYIKWTTLGLGLTYGTLMGIGRMAQGAHFASDVLWSGGLTYLSAAVLHHVVLPNEKTLMCTPASLLTVNPQKKFLGWILLSAALVLLTVFFLLATPFYKTWSGKIEKTSLLTAVQLNLPSGKEEIQIVHAKQDAPIIVQAELRGFGFPKLELTGKLTSEYQGTTLTASLTLAVNRITTERLGTIRFSVRKDLCLILQSKSRDRDIRIGKKSLAGRYGPIKIQSEKGSILFRPWPGSDIQGPVQLATQCGDIHLVIEEIHDPGNQQWEVKTDKGTVLLETTQSQVPKQKLKLRCWSRLGTVVYKGTVSPTCGLNLQWDEGNGHSVLHTQGIWYQQGNQILGPTDMDIPYFEIYLATSSGLLDMEITPVQTYTKSSPTDPMP